MIKNVQKVALALANGHQGEHRQDAGNGPASLPLRSWDGFSSAPSVTSLFCNVPTLNHHGFFSVTLCNWNHISGPIKNHCLKKKEKSTPLPLSLAHSLKGCLSSSTWAKSTHMTHGTVQWKGHGTWMASLDTPLGHVCLRSLSLRMLICEMQIILLP